jgi:nitrite reductase/ring-hydroxylating ferredoxin subunit
VEALEAAGGLDGPGKAVGKAVRGALSPGAVKDALSGTWLGHALHPLLTDVVIGSFVSASLLDVLGGDADGSAAERLIGVGIAAYGPTALTGVNDWADTEVTDDRVRRIGLVHAGSNLTALGLYTASLAARRRGARGRGKLLGLSGAAVLAAGGYLGAHMSFVQGVGPNQTAFDEGPDEWTPAVDAGDLADGEPKAAVVGDTPVLLVRHGDSVHALHDRCSHRGCLLSDGEVDGHLVVCACHGSRFDLRDGSVDRGPATAPQPAYEAREREGRIEIRLRADA